MTEITGIETDYAYAAGLLDGEGSIGVYLGHRREPALLGFSISIGNTDLRLLVWLQERFGGRLGKGRMAKLAASPIYRWRVGREEGLAFLTLVEPYLLAKCDQAQLFRELTNLTVQRGRGHTISPENLARRVALIADLKAAKRSLPPGARAPTENLVLPVDCAYAAGILDGEGCITVRLDAHRSPGHMLFEVVIANTDLRFLLWLHDRFGGRVVQARVAKGNFRTLYAWRIGRKEGLAFLDHVEPYLIAKRYQAQVFRELAALSIRRGRTRTIPPENLQRRLFLVADLKDAKRRKA